MTEPRPAFIAGQAYTLVALTQDFIRNGICPKDTSL